jgi:hypothetical protein
MIDHPLDPENKYLYHAAIESSEVLNIYSGNVTTDGGGEAVVKIPSSLKRKRQTMNAVSIFLRRHSTSRKRKACSGLAIPNKQEP